VHCGVGLPPPPLHGPVPASPFGAHSLRTQVLSFKYSDRACDVELAMHVCWQLKLVHALMQAKSALQPYAGCMSGGSVIERSLPAAADMSMPAVPSPPPPLPPPLPPLPLLPLEPQAASSTTTLIIVNPRFIEAIPPAGG
jgi:hypothetical protein